MRVLFLIFCLLLFRCTDVLSPTPFKDTQDEQDPSPEDFREVEKPNQDDRPIDEIPIGGEKLGNVFISPKNGEPTQSGAPVTSGSQNTPQSPNAPRTELPKPTHIVTVICRPNMEIIVESGSLQAKAPLSSASHCATLVSALNARSFPTGLTVAQLKGGPTMGATCIGGSLDLEIRADQGGIPSISTLALGDESPCLEIRNVINNLMI